MLTHDFNLFRRVFFQELIVQIKSAKPPKVFPQPHGKVVNYATKAEES